MAVKLFFITGIPWIFEFISHLASRLDGANLGLYYFLVCCQLLNTSRGVFIFVNFILLNRDVRKFLWSHIKILFKREPRMPVDFNAINHADTDQSTSNLTTQSTPATCSETISNIESFEYDEYTYLWTRNRKRYFATCLKKHAYNYLLKPFGYSFGDFV